MIASLTFESDNKTLFGTDPMTAMLVLAGTWRRCRRNELLDRTGSDVGVVRQMKQVAKIPVLAKPNAGLPKLDSEGERFMKWMRKPLAGRCVCL